MLGYNIEFSNPVPALILGAVSMALIIVMLRRTKLHRLVLKKTLYLEESWTSTVLTILKLLTIILLIIGVAQPVIVVEKTISVETVDVVRKYGGELPVNYIVLVDVSPSMHRYGMENVVEVLDSLVKALNSSDRLVLAVFGGEVNKLYEGTPINASNYVELIPFYEYNYTAIGDALTWALSYASIAPLPSAVIVISDGANNYGGDPLKAVHALNESGVPVVFVKTGDDPRGYRLFGELVKRGYTVVEPTGLDRGQLNKLVESIVYESKYVAVKMKGRADIVYRDEEPIPPELLLYPAIALFILSRIEGV